MQHQASWLVLCVRGLTSSSCARPKHSGLSAQNPSSERCSSVACYLHALSKRIGPTDKRCERKLMTQACTHGGHSTARRKELTFVPRKKLCISLGPR